MYLYYNMSDKQPTILCSIDIETSGPNIIKNGIISIGYCIGSLHGKLLIKKRINMKLDDDCTFDNDTLQNFWMKHLPILEKLRENQVSPKDGMTEFTKDIDEYDSKYKLVIISDNVSFDISFVNYYLAKYLDRKPLSYKLNKYYRSIYDTDSYSRGILNQSYDNLNVKDYELIKKYKITIKSNKEQAHYPDDDAYYIYELHRKIVLAVNNPITFFS
jgi:DNA polymerase III epsilon subunit-like protein